MPASFSTSTSPAGANRRAIVIGGSLGGLFVGNLLRTIGWDVEIFERSAQELDSRGGGIVLQPEVSQVFRRTGVEMTNLGVRSANRIVLRRDGSVQSKEFAPQTQTSWSLIYTSLKTAFGDAHYHPGKTLTRVEQDANGVTAFFADGTDASGDLLIGADGGNSTVRRQYWPDQHPDYAGYLAWRGLVPENDMPPAAREMLHGDFAFANDSGSHMLGYLVPGAQNDVRDGHRLYNWVWYRATSDELLAEIMLDREGRSRGNAIPEGKLADRWIAHVRDDADALLPLPFREIVHATKQPFAQAIRDLASDQMVSGRVVVIGDAAAIVRPHTAAGTSKAAANALELVEALKRFPDDVEAALAEWEPAQIALAKSLRRQGIESGHYLLFRHPPVARVG